jgi:hypothetical protein
LSPILVRPVREQLEHDRIIRLLQAKFRRKYEAGINAGAEQVAPVGSGPSAMYPDVVAVSLERGRRLEIVVEVETGESVNHLEALAQWVPYSKLRAAFHLYVPSNMVEVARRLCEDNHIAVSELWSYLAVGEDVRFTLIQKARETAPPRHAPVPSAAASRRSAPIASAKRPARAVKSASPRKTAKKAAGRGRAPQRASSTATPRTQKRK